MNDDSPKPRRLKQYIIVKEYNGNDNDAKPTIIKKRRYIEKTILKERVPKEERDSLKNIDFVKLEKEIHEKNDNKYIELIDTDDVGNVDVVKEVEFDSSIKTNNTLLYAVVAAGGLLGAYALIHTTSSSKN